MSTHKGARPIPQPSLRVGVLWDRQGAEVGPLIVSVAERKENGFGGDVEDWPSRGIELEFRDAVDRESVGRILKSGGRSNGVAKNILRPSHICSGSHRDMTGNQPKISAFARPKHQAVRPEANWTTIAIHCSVMNAEPDQNQLHDGPVQTQLRSMGLRNVTVSRSTPSISNHSMDSAGGAFDVGSVCSQLIILLAIT